MTATITPSTPPTPAVAPEGKPATPSARIATARPPFRRLHVYAFDPSLDTEMETAVINRVTLSVPWEDELGVGPVGEYVEVVDFDPASDCFYEPVTLSEPYLLAQDGLEPSEGNPKFHQQMVYAVAMATIRNFERALGRSALWASRRAQTNGGWIEEYVPRLRIYPHALREANAYYSPEKKALLFGYFPASAADPGKHLPGGTVFTCLSHDIIAHETTHALLDGMHRRFIEPTNPDTLAFHEAFADIVALFQHFSLPEVLRHQIGKTRGDLASQNLLGELAQQFGFATGGYGALRSALGTTDDKRQWHPAEPKPGALETTMEPHERGSLLVAAVFDAFLSIYKSRVADLLRIATSGSGVLPQGALHPDLVNRLAGDAAKSAQHVLNMCIRALDYCPPVDLTFGEYLRALITADWDLVRDDDRGYRVAVIEAFRRRGIYPRDVRSLSEDSLRWCPPAEKINLGQMHPVIQKIEELKRDWDLTANRESIYDCVQATAKKLHGWVEEQRGPGLDNVMGLDLTPEGPKVEVHSVRPARRVGPDGDVVVDLVIEITQRRPGFFSDDPAKQDPKQPDFWFRGGCTLLVNVDGGEVEVRYCICKRLNDARRMARQKAFLTGGSDASLQATYFGSILQGDHKEPFAFLHSPLWEEKP